MSNGYQGYGSHGSSPPGYRDGPPGCVQGHSYGGWSQNNANYYGNGQIGLYIYGEGYDSGCSPNDLCYYSSNSPYEYHINDSGCVGTYSYYAGKRINLSAGNNLYYHHMDGAGHYP